MNSGFIQPPNSLIQKPKNKNKNNENIAINYPMRKDEYEIKTRLAQEIKQNPEKVVDELYKELVEKKKDRTDEN